MQNAAKLEIHAWRHPLELDIAIPQVLIGLTTGKKVQRKTRNGKMQPCQDVGWVCETHPGKPWGGPNACPCGAAGAP
jgi:hypothetical protein